MYPNDQLFSDKRKFKRLNMAFYDTIRIYEGISILYSFTSSFSDMNFQMILIPIVILATKKFTKEAYLLEPFLSFKKVYISRN